MTGSGIRVSQLDIVHYFLSITNQAELEGMHSQAGEAVKVLLASKGAANLILRFVYSLFHSLLWSRNFRKSEEPQSF